MTNDESVSNKSIWHNPTVAGVVGSVATVFLTKLGDWSKDWSWGVPSWLLALSEWLQQKQEISNAVFVVTCGAIILASYMSLMLVRTMQAWRNRALRAEILNRASKNRAPIAAEVAAGNAVTQPMSEMAEVGTVSPEEISISEPTSRKDSLSLEVAEDIQVHTYQARRDAFSYPSPSARTAESIDVAMAARTYIAALEAYAKDCAEAADKVEKLSLRMTAAELSKGIDLPIFVLPLEADKLVLEHAFISTLDHLASRSRRAQRFARRLRDSRDLDWQVWQVAFLAYCGELGMDALNFASSARNELKLDQANKNFVSMLSEALSRAGEKKETLPAAYHLT